MQIMIEPIIQQRTAEWHQQRLGKVTASRVADALAKTKTGWGAPRSHYLMQLVVERLTGEPTPFFANPAMEWGTATEPYARIAYSELTGRTVVETGFTDHPTIPMTGASPDGLVDDDGLVEIKCPNSATQIKTLLGDPIDGDYVKQMQWQLAVTGRKWCDFVSYDPRLPEGFRIFIKRFERDDAMISQLEADIRTFLASVDETITTLLALAEADIPF
jgi:putative phage-type endonuclease